MASPNYRNGFKCEFMILFHIFLYEYSSIFSSATLFMEVTQLNFSAPKKLYFLNFWQRRKKKWYQYLIINI